MTAFTAANLSVATFNLVLTFIMFGLMIAHVPPPAIGGWAVAGIFACAEISIWLGVYAYASGSIA